MDEPKQTPPEGKCKCEDFPIEPPEENGSFRRFLTFMENHLGTLPSVPPEPIKKFRDDLKEADKEYEGVAAAVSKYKLFFDTKLGSALTDAKGWKKEIECWLEDFDEGTADKIDEIWTWNYEAQELEEGICCDWIKERDAQNETVDCLENAKRKEQDAKDDYDGAKGGGAVKDWEKTLTDRFSDLKALFEKAQAFNAERRYNALYAASKEFSAVYDNLGVLRDWGYARKKCGGKKYGEGGAYGEIWSPEEFKKKLIAALRALVLARYQTFQWQYKFLSQTAKLADMKAACVKFRESRRTQFIQEAEDVPSPPAKPGNREGTSEQQQTEGRQESSSV